MIVISPIGDLDASLINTIGFGIKRRFGYLTEIMPLLEDIGFALDPVRDQYLSTSIIEQLARLAPTHAIKVLAICTVDLFIPILTHVYGEAQLGGKACIISILRLKEEDSPMNNPETFHVRVEKEAIHELGHTFDLRHCQDHSCIMHYCRTVKDVDRKSDQLCRYCKILLEDEIKRLAKE
jgi:archaemetzincin